MKQIFRKMHLREQGMTEEEAKVHELNILQNNFLLIVIVKKLSYVTTSILGETLLLL